MLLRKAGRQVVVSFLGFMFCKRKVRDGVGVRGVEGGCVVCVHHYLWHMMGS